MNPSEQNQSNQSQPEQVPTPAQQTSPQDTAKVTIGDLVHTMYGRNLIAVLALFPPFLIINTFTDWRSSVTGIIIGFAVMIIFAVATLVIILKLFPESK